MTDHDDETDEERTARGGQLSNADISKMFAEKRYGEIEDARKAGRINVAMNGEPPLDPAKVVTAQDVKALYASKNYDAIEQLRKDGRLNALLSPTAQTTQENNS